MTDKYGNVKMSHAGYSFASKLEAALFDLLNLEMKAGIWTDIQCQASVYLTEAKILYKPDFKVVSSVGDEAYAEAKGFETDTWRIKRRLWKHYGPGPLMIYKGSSRGPFVFETIIPREAA